MRKHELKDDAFTGLEAAIVLIAFVVVAAVFSYVVLGAGFFTTQKSQETIYAGVGQSTSNVEVVGPVAIKANGDGDNVAELYFKIKGAAGSSDIDLQQMTYTISTKGDIVDYTYDDITVEKIGDFTLSDELLKPGYIVELQFTSGLPSMPTNTQFSIEIKPAVGAPLLLQKTTPAGYSADGFYELY